MYRRIWGQLSPPFFQEFLSDAANLQGTTSFPCDSTIRPSRKRFISGKSLKRGRKKPSRFYYLTAFPSRRSPFPYPRFLLYTPSARKPSPIKNPASLRKAGYGKKTPQGRSFAGRPSKIPRWGTKIRSLGWMGIALSLMEK